MSTIFLQHFHNKSHMISYYQFKKICDKLIVAIALPKQGGKKNCNKLIMAMALPKQGEKKICDNLIVAMPLPKQGNKKIFSNCGNGIVENRGKKKWFRNLGNSKKKNCHVHNIFTTFLQ